MPHKFIGLFWIKNIKKLKFSFAAELTAVKEGQKAAACEVSKDVLLIPGHCGSTSCSCAVSHLCILPQC